MKSKMTCVACGEQLPPLCISCVTCVKSVLTKAEFKTWVKLNEKVISCLQRRVDPFNIMSTARWEKFFDLLNGPGYCDFHKDARGKTVWTCAQGAARPLTVKALTAMKLSSKKISEVLDYCASTGGYCDCEVLFNTMPCVPERAEQKQKKGEE